ncbi:MULTISPECIES: carbohydrate ABC transporter permease [unclassified Microbacterium]|uniref:carbohydrate ABC transporter permease n=1 Tax=unclassified Microbacterium TaxID=2609290 RepID=UPI0030161F16
MVLTTAPVTASAAGNRASGHRRSRLRGWEARAGWLMAAPAIIGVVVFTLGPMIASLLISFTDWSIGLAPSFVGVQNYQRLFTEDPLFVKSLWVTLYFTLGSVPLILALGFGIALLLNADVRGKGFFRTIYYLPTLVPAVANAVLWTWMFNPDFGLFNEVLKGVGLAPWKWTYGEGTVTPSLILMSAWGFGNVMVIFLAGLQGVPKHLYEALAVDGGNQWHAFTRITLPMMSPTIFYCLVTVMIASFQTFYQAYVMTNGGPNNASTFFVYYLYDTAFRQSKMGYASALAWILFVIIGAITLLLFRWARSWVYYETAGGR